MVFSFQHLTSNNGEWPRLTDQWCAECEHYAEDFEVYRLGSLSVAASVAESPDDRNTRIYGLLDRDNTYVALCFANRAMIKGYPWRYYI